MAALPYMQFYVADYLADTMHLSTEEHGAYLLLIFNYWQTGKPLPKNRLAGIARLSNDRWTDVERSLNEFFIDDGNAWVHQRIERDLLSVKGAQSQRSEAGKISAQKRLAKKTQGNQSKHNARSTGVQRGDNDRSTNIDTDKDKDLKDKTPHSAQAREEDFLSGDQKFQMFDGWSPSGDLPPEHTPEELEDFVLFWSAGGQLFNQAQWEQKFTRSVQRYRQHAKTKKSGGSHAKQNTANANASAFGRVRARHNEWRISQGLEPLGDDDEAVWPPLGPEERGGTLHDLDPGDFEVLG